MAEVGNIRTNMKFKKQADPSKCWVRDILDFETPEQYKEYCEDFKFNASEFMSLFVTAVIQRLIYEKQPKTTFEIEDQVELTFSTSLYLETIKMVYVDTRSMLRKLQYNTVESIEYFNGVKVNKEGDGPADDYFKYNSHSFYNKPIYHSTKIYQKQDEKNPNKWLFDFDGTYIDFLKQFILFANVIDVEHAQMDWFMKQEENRKSGFMKTSELGINPRKVIKTTPRKTWI